MAQSIITLLFALVILGLLLMRLEIPAAIGPVQASGALERWSMKLLLPLLALAGVGIPFFVKAPYGDSLRPLVLSTSPHAIIVIVLGSAAAVGVSAVIHKRTSVPYAVMGALVGYRYVTDGALNWSQAGGLVLSWVLASLLCCVLTFLLAKAFIWYATRPGRHLALVDQRLLTGCLVGSLLMVGSCAWNLGQLITLFPRMLLGSGPLPVCFSLGVVALMLLFRARRSLLGEDSDFGSCSALAVMLAMTVCFLLFSWPGIRQAGLTPTPLSACSLLMAGLVGVSLAQQNGLVSGEDVVKSAAASLAAPVLGFLITYCLGMVLSTLILVGIVAVAAALILYVRAQQAEARRTEMLRSREEQVYSTQKSLSALEVRVETHEKELLNKLENKRKELVDYAVGVSDQKAFMEKVYARLTQVREMPDGLQKQQALDEVLDQLRERMYFTREMNDFYARTEILHRDFNMRLKEAFPHLTESERKLANLLRQGFSTKSIASLMNITPKSVEISRYRLRTKLGLSRTDNLVQYIKSI